MKLTLIILTLIISSATWANRPSLTDKAEIITEELSYVLEDLNRNEKQIISYHISEIADTLKVDLSQFKPRTPLYCKHTNNNFYRLINIRTGVELDNTGTSLEVCNQRKKESMGIYCKHTNNDYFRLSNMKGSEIDNKGTNLESCLKRIPARRTYLVCKHTNNDYYRVTTLTGHEIDISGTSLEACISRL